MSITSVLLTLQSISMHGMSPASTHGKSPRLHIAKELHPKACIYHTVPPLDSLHAVYQRSVTYAHSHLATRTLITNRVPV